MGSSSHIQGLPQTPSLVSSRSTAAVQQRQRERDADLRRAIYVRPLGKKLALVKNFCNDQPYVVGNVFGGTFSPGSEVFLGSNTGHPGEVIIAGPPPSSEGGARFGQATFARFGPKLPEPPPPPPISPPAIVGIYDDGTNLHAWAYNADGSFRDEMSVIVRPWIPSGSVFPFSVPYASLESGLVLLFVNNNYSDRMKFAIWDFEANQPPPPPSTSYGSAKVVTLPNTYGGNPFYWTGVPFVDGGSVKILSTYWDGGGGPDPNTLWSVPLTGGTPTALSTLGPDGGFYWPRAFDDTYLYISVTNTKMVKMPLDGSAPFQVSTSTNVISAYVRLCTALSYSGADRYWCGPAQNYTVERRQVLMRWNAAANQFAAPVFNSTTPATPLGAASDPRARSVSLDHETSGIYPWDAPAPTGVVMKLLRPRGATTDSGNNSADPRITLAANGGHTPQYAFLYDFPAPW